jgi:hypothetical protein
MVETLIIQTLASNFHHNSLLYIDWKESQLLVLLSTNRTACWHIDIFIATVAKPVCTKQPESEIAVRITHTPAHEPNKNYRPLAVFKR